MNHLSAFIVYHRIMIDWLVNLQLEMRSSHLPVLVVHEVYGFGLSCLNFGPSQQGISWCSGSNHFKPTARTSFLSVMICMKKWEKSQLVAISVTLAVQNPFSSHPPFPKRTPPSSMVHFVVSSCFIHIQHAFLGGPWWHASTWFSMWGNHFFTCGELKLSQMDVIVFMVKAH